MRVSVIGGGEADDRTVTLAERAGEELARRGHTVVCGGLGGVMAGVCEGAKRAGGRTIGILPGTERSHANPHVDEAIATGLGNARNVLVAMNGDGVLAIDGHYGTLSEIAHALDMGRPVVGLKVHEIAGVEPADSPEDAVTYLEQALL